MRRLIPLLLLPPVLAVAGDGGMPLSLEGLARDAAAGTVLLRTRADRDSDGDGVPDAGELRAHCDRSTLLAFHYRVVSPRDSASGQASGKRSAPRPARDWGPPSPPFRTLHPRVTVDAATAADADGWRIAKVDGLADVCGEAARPVNIPRPNVRGR